MSDVERGTINGGSLAVASDGHGAGGARIVVRPRASKALPCVSEVQGKEYLGPEDVAVLLGVSLHTVRAWRKRDYLPRAFKFQKVIRWKREVIEGWIKDHLERAQRPGLRYNGPTRLSGRATQ